MEIVSENTSFAFDLELGRGVLATSRRGAGWSASAKLCLDNGGQLHTSWVLQASLR